MQHCSDSSHTFAQILVGEQVVSRFLSVSCFHILEAQNNVDGLQTLLSCSTIEAAQIRSDSRVSDLEESESMLIVVTEERENERERETRE